MRPSFIRRQRAARGEQKWPSIAPIASFPTGPSTMSPGPSGSTGPGTSAIGTARPRRPGTSVLLSSGGPPLASRRSRSWPYSQWLGCSAGRSRAVLDRGLRPPRPHRCFTASISTKEDLLAVTDMNRLHDAQGHDDRPALAYREFRTAALQAERRWHGHALPPAVQAQFPTRHPGLAIAVWTVALAAIVCL